MVECAERGCGREATVRVYVPWEEDRDVCAPHARAIAQQDGVVAEPVVDADADGEWPQR